MDYMGPYKQEWRTLRAFLKERDCSVRVSWTKPHQPIYVHGKFMGYARAGSAMGVYAWYTAAANALTYDVTHHYITVRPMVDEASPRVTLLTLCHEAGHALQTEEWGFARRASASGVVLLGGVGRERDAWRRGVTLWREVLGKRLTREDREQIARALLTYNDKRAEWFAERL